MSTAAVRLTSSERQSIRDAVEAAAVRAGVHWRQVSLFGSRVNPLAKGGDIDLYVAITALPGSVPAAFARALRLELEDRLGERKVDLLVDDGQSDLGPFGEIVKSTKVDLWTTT